MDLGAPIATGNLTISSMTIRADITKITSEGTVGKYGRVFVTHTLKASDESRVSYQFEAFGRTIMEDGSMVSGSARGTGRRNNGHLTLFSLDNLSNGEQNFSVLEMDVQAKSASIKVYSL